MVIERLLEDRALPDLLTGLTDKAAFERMRPDLVRILSECAYGTMPATPDRLSVVETGRADSFCAGKATLRHLRFDAELDGNAFSFPVYAAVPRHEEEIKVPAIVFLNFRAAPFDEYLPMEEIMDRGYAVFGIHHEGVSSDDDDFTSGCAKYLCPNRTMPDAPGKIVIWAWAALRVMDYIAAQAEFDLNHTAVAGHSRLGKTALVAAVHDERFKYVIANNSGCMGAAISRGKIGEDPQYMADKLSFWFCPEFARILKGGRSLPFDQHYLLSLIAPRHILLGCAEEDTWADPSSEYLCLCKANEVYKLYHMDGFIHPDAVPETACEYASGDSAYHLRQGTHYLSRTDWQSYLDFMDRRRGFA